MSNLNPCSSYGKLMTDCQPFPHNRQMKQNLSLDTLRNRIVSSQGMVYCYVVASVLSRDGKLIQTGSAPNFQGGMISLCTCKHFLRSFLEVDQWPKTWIAGFTGKKAGNGRNALFYLMKVKQAFESHYDLWFSDNVALSVKQRKSARLDKFGDVFEPKRDGIAKFSCQQYHPPVSDHVHSPTRLWHKDIRYDKGVRGRTPSLLFGDPKYSFLWDQPQVFHSEQLHRGQQKIDLQTLIKELLHEDRDRQ